MNWKSTKSIEKLKVNAVPALIITIIVLAVTLPIFNELIFGTTRLPAKDRSDFYAHVLMIIDGSKTGLWPSYPIFHLLTYVLSFGSQSITFLSQITIVVMGLFVSIKAVFSYFILNEEIRSSRKSALVALALLFLMPIFNWWTYRIYLGQIAMNVWHNPTTIIAMPFSIILFYYAIKKIDSSKILDYVIISILVVLNLLSKPNYVLVFLPIYFIVLFVKLLKGHKLNVLIGMLIISAASISVLFIQYLLTYGGAGNTTTGIVFTFFGVWTLTTPYILFSFLLSTAFPLTYALLYFSELKKNVTLLISWAVYFLAILEYSFLAESGIRFAHGNFGWGSIMSLYILFLTTAAKFFAQKKSGKFMIVLVVFLLHLLAGAYYYLRLITGRGYF